MIVIIDYDAGNTCSVTNALDRLNADYVLSDDARQIQGANKVIFPGVGHAGAAMEALRRKDLVSVIQGLTQPVLGICVGMQLYARESAEGNTSCLGILDTKVTKFDESMKEKVPHMGWNTVHQEVDDILFEQLDKSDYYYFVHSYYMPLSEHSTGTCSYQLPFSAAVRKDNFWGIQFHAEKSGIVGAKLLSNFLEKA